MFEDEEKNRMEDALELFESCVNSPGFESKAIILFLNKMDLFTEKIKDDAKQIADVPAVSGMVCGIE